MIRNRSNVSSYVTKDGSRIWELFHPDSSPIEGFSVAEALVDPGQLTIPHRHVKSREVYYIIEGSGILTHGDDKDNVSRGDAIHLPPGTVHYIKNTGTGSLRILCICCPPYSHDDTDTGM